ncbi:MAG: Arylsulfatase [Verrucomicrobia subdivision 3 bacterium]|nr:Arylsulfatase [Limisphaerales bacterium]MCS1413670.1 Arylsulfatase [Limisphaerales bacterium]
MVWALTFLLGGSLAAAERPNIIFIMADDLGYGDLGCFGQQVIQTPNIDCLAAEGMRLTSFYAGCTVCRPSRLALWTGRHTEHTPISSNAQYVFQPSDVTVAELLSEVGYATGGIGKWAMGRPGTSGHPNLNGFKFWMGYLDQSEAHNYYPTHLWRNFEKVLLAGNELSLDPAARGRVSVKRVTYSHDRMTEEALDFIRREAAGQFLLHVHWTIPHANNEGGRVTGDGMEVPNYSQYADRDWPTLEKGQAAMIDRMDKDVGRLTALLGELKIDRNTLVIFTSDNGPHSEGNHRHEFFDSNGPLRGFKRDLYEGGIRVPAIAWWPGVIQAGTVSDEPLAFWDFLPTACELAGRESQAPTDGISFVPLLRGEAQRSHDYLFWKFNDKLAVRQREWKAVKPGRNQGWELYNLREDLGETTSLADRQQKKLQELKQLVRLATE